jgi:putative transposase
MLSRKENCVMASKLMQEAVFRYAIDVKSLTIHQDQDTPMTAHCYLDLLSELAVIARHSSPRVSNDNSMSEAQFKFLKYQHNFLRRFQYYDHGQRWCEGYVNGKRRVITTYENEFCVVGLG